MGHTTKWLDLFNEESRLYVRLVSKPRHTSYALGLWQLTLLKAEKLSKYCANLSF